MPPDYTMFTADVAVEDHNEIAQDFCCMLAHSQGTFCRVEFRINTMAPAVGLSSAPKKTKTMLRIIWYRPCFLPHEPEKNKKKCPTRTHTCAYAVKLLLRYSTGKIKSNPLGPHFETSATMSQSVAGTKTAAALPHCCSESALESIAGRCVFGSAVWLELWHNYGMSYKKNTEVEVLPVTDLFKESAKYHFFVGGATQVDVEEYLPYIPFQP